MATKNENLHAAKKAKNDEFYTMLEDIEKELQHYGDFFRGKSVYCNCDHPTDSNFTRYFLEMFEELGIERLTATCYVPGGRGWKGEKMKGGEYTVEQMDGDGDFRSEECIELLKQADVVVTNPPFSLFREYVAQLMEYGKKFLIIGNQNAITYKEIFPYIKSNELLLGVSMNGSNRWFQVPDDYEIKPNAAGFKMIDGKKHIFVNGVVWFTNISHAPAGKPLILEKRYVPENYPKYDNYDAIEVSKTVDIPVDYDGVMGVPISFLSKYCPDQFEIVGITENSGTVSYLYIDSCEKYDRQYLDGKRLYSRILIRRKDALEASYFEIVGWTRHNDKDMDGGYWQGGKADATINGKEVYRRILIRRKQKIADQPRC